MEHPMNLHESQDVCLEFTRATAKHFNIPNFYVEKDYWVTGALKRLHESESVDSVVLKGGTALSKAHRIIERFSEDIDLALRPDDSLSDARRKALIRKIEKTAAQDLQYQQGHPQESKGSRFRRTAHAFPTLTDAVELGQVSEVILIEVNSFANPHPSATMPIATLIRDFLFDINREDLISEYKLEPFKFLVLSIERTLCEKIMALVRASHEQDPVAALRNQIRHFYDIAMIMRDQVYQDFVANQAFLDLIAEVRRTDREVASDAWTWTDPPLYEAVVFSDVTNSWARVSSELHGNFREMVFGDSIPEDDEILSCLGRIRDSLQSER